MVLLTTRGIGKKEKKKPADFDVSAGFFNKKYILKIVRNHTIIRLLRIDEVIIVSIRHSLNENLNEINCLYHNISMKLGLSDSESMILYMLYDEQKPITQSDIVKSTGMSKQTLNSAIRNLEKDEIIILEKLNEKSKHIVVTDKGRRVIQERILPIVEIEERVLNSWSEDETKFFLELTERFKKQFGEEVNAYGKE